jgi:hypothetical protein
MPASAPASPTRGEPVTATQSSPLQTAPSAPVGMLALLVLAGGLYLWLMVSITGPNAHGDAVVGQALEQFFLTVFLWGALAVLLAVGGVMGEMPRWAAILAFFAHPLSVVGALIAIDMMSRNAKWAFAAPALLPLLLGFYATWARFPRLHAAMPARTTSIAVWAAVLILAIAPMPISYWGPGTFGR